MLFSKNVVTFVHSPVRPSFFTMTVLLVLLPLAHVLCSIHVGVNTKTVSLVVDPISLVDISIRMYQSSFSVGLVILPEPFVEGAVWPVLLAPAFPLIIRFVPLSNIDSSVLQFVWLPPFATFRLLI